MFTISVSDEQFPIRIDMSFRIRDPKKAEPSDWQVDKWYISWTALPVVALVGFIAGLMAAG